MSNVPLISIIMPAYNAGEFIEQAIHSVLKQDYQAWELIIVDDASTDNTVDIVKRLIKDNPDRKIYCETVEHQGTPSAVRNVGLRMAMGDFIAFLDADDEYFDTTLSTLYQPLMQDESLLASFGFPEFMDKNRNSQGVPPQLEEVSENQYRLASHVDLSWKYLSHKYFPCYLSALLFRRQCLKDIGFFDETVIVGEDVLFFYKIFMLGLERVKLIPACVYRYRLSSDSVTRNYSRERIHEWFQCREKISTWLFEQPVMTVELQPYRSVRLAENYTFFSNRCLENKDYMYAVRFMIRLFQDKSVTFSDACYAFAQFAGRRYLSPVYKSLLTLRTLRYRLFSKQKTRVFTYN